MIETKKEQRTDSIPGRKRNWLIRKKGKKTITRAKSVRGKKIEVK